jgi:hypothetical protein
MIPTKKGMLGCMAHPDEQSKQGSNMLVVTLLNANLKVWLLDCFAALRLFLSTWFSCQISREDGDIHQKLPVDESHLDETLVGFSFVFLQTSSFC